MKYIVKYDGKYVKSYPMYMIDTGSWSRKLSEATILDSNQQAVNLALSQYPSSYRAWDNLVMLEYTDKEYFKELLKRQE